ncbi:MAG: ABC-F family ATP-binding cassette domain-containing protein [Negativicutes bacterium]|jgi:ATP-binding cassette subfamily F protein 3
MLIQLKNISKYFVTNCVFANADIMVNDDARIGVVGMNGAGKTTLLKIINGAESYDDGEIFKKKNLTIGTLTQQHDFDGELTIFETVLAHFADIIRIEKKLRELEAKMAVDVAAEADYARLIAEFERLDGYTVDARANAVLNGLGFGSAKEKQVKVLSGGEKTRLGLALLLVDEPELLLLDEPTNHLDMDMIEWLEKYLRDYRGGVLIVTHDRYFLDRTCREIVEVENKKIKTFTGNYSQYIVQKTMEREAAEKAYLAQKEEMEAMRDFVARNMARASTSTRAKSKLKALEKIQLLDKPVNQKQIKFKMIAGPPSGNDVLTLRDLKVSVGNGSRELIRDLQLLVKRGERIAVIGPNGAGKTTLLKTLAGKHREHSGRIRWGENVKTYYYDQEQTCLSPGKTVLNELWDDYPRLDEVRVRSLLGRLLFSGDDVFKQVEVLSGGEKARIAIAKLLLTNTNTLVLDEPTNHIDIYCREVLEETLADYAGTIIFVSHDRYFIDKLATRVLEISDGRATIYSGGFSEYHERKERERLLPKTDKVETAAESKQSGATSCSTPKIKNAEQKIAQLEERIKQLETETAVLERELMRASATGDQERIGELYTMLEHYRAETMQKMTEWEKNYSSASLYDSL